MKTYIIGAGFSKSYEKSPTLLKMPLANEIFKTYNQLDISSNPNVLVGDIINYVGQVYNISPLEFINFNMNIEDLHSEIEEKLNEALLKDNFLDKVTYYRVYNQLVFLFTSVINEIQNGPISKAHYNFIETIEDNDSIITFNWDTLIDRALKEHTNWNIDTGYLVQPHIIYRNKWDENNKNDIFPLKLIKLHGSTNWLTSHTSFDHDDGSIKLSHKDNLDRFYAYEFANEPYSCYRGRYLGVYEDFSYGYYPPNIPEDGLEAPPGHVFVRMAQKTPFTPVGSSNESGLVSMPLIIPPIKHKKYSFFGSLFPSLWEYAQKSIEIADKIIILGYSFPKTDVKTNDLFMNAFLKRKSIPDIVIVNPFPDSIYHKFVYELGIPEKKIVIFKEYIDEGFDFKKLI